MLYTRQFEQTLPYERKADSQSQSKKNYGGAVNQEPTHPSCHKSPGLMVLRRANSEGRAQYSLRRSTAVSSMELKHILCQIDINRRHVAHGISLLFEKPLHARIGSALGEEDVHPINALCGHMSAASSQPEYPINPPMPGTRPLSLWGDVPEIR